MRMATARKFNGNGTWLSRLLNAFCLLQNETATLYGGEYARVANVLHYSLFLFNKKAYVLMCDVNILA